MNRRTFIGSGIAMFLAAACDQLPSDRDDLLDFSVPSPEDILFGEAHLVWDSDGAIYQLLPEQHAIAKLSEVGGAELWRTGELGEEQGGLNYPSHMSHTKDGKLVVVERGNHRLSTFEPDGKFAGHIGTGWGSEAGELHSVTDAVVHPNGKLYVCDGANHRVQVFNLDGSHATMFGELGTDEQHHLNYPRSIAVDPGGHLHIVDAGNARVQVFDADGKWLRQYGESGAGDGKLHIPRSVAVDPLGNAYVTDPSVGGVQVFGANGKHLTTFNNFKVGDVVASVLDVQFTHQNKLYTRLHVHRAA